MKFLLFINALIFALTATASLTLEGTIAQNFFDLLLIGQEHNHNADEISNITLNAHIACQKSNQNVKCILDNYTQKKSTVILDTESSKALIDIMGESSFPLGNNASISCLEENDVATCTLYLSEQLL